MKKFISILTLAFVLFSSAVEAVPWCHRGTIVQIADVTWNQSQILANFSGPIPAGVFDPEYYVTFTSIHNYANTFAGGGGGFGGYSVPGSGQVIVIPYAPFTYTSMVGPGHYFTSQGIQFKLRKCYTIPPMVQVLNYDEISLPNGPVIEVKPFKGLKRMKKYWRTGIADGDDDKGNGN